MANCPGIDPARLGAVGVCLAAGYAAAAAAAEPRLRAFVGIGGYYVDYYTRRAAVPNRVHAFALMSREHFLPFNVMAPARGVFRGPKLLGDAPLLLP